MPQPDPKRETQPDQAETQVSFTETPTRVKGSESGKPPADFLAALSERYEVLNELGQGGMGVVYRARDLETDEIVALKLLKPEIADNQDLMERFRNELRLARKITHKNVCRTHELLRFGETYVISMEYVEGDSLRHVLNRFGGLPFKKAIQLAGEVCAGLAEAHSQGVVHRDLKPENVMLDEAGYAKVMDFGIARSFSAEASTAGGVIGTPDYMSPEQAESKSVDARTDVYLLGLLLYEIFTGERAFTGDTPVAVVLKQIKETPAPPSHIEPGIPRHVETVILRCLEKDPAKRFQSIAEIGKALRQERQTPAPKEVVEEVALPLRLARWQKSDWALLAAAVVSFGLFLSLFDAVFPYAGMKAPFSREVAIGKAHELIKRFGSEAGQGGSLTAAYVRNRDDTWSWAAFNSSPRSSIRFNPQGSLREIALWDRLRQSRSKSSGTKILSVEEARPRAETLARELFRVSPPAEPPRKYQYDIARERWIDRDPRQKMSDRDNTSYEATPVDWEFETGGEKQQILIWVLGEDVAYASFGPVQDPSLRTSGWWIKSPMIRNDRNGKTILAANVALLFSLFCLLLFFVRRLHKQLFKPVLALSISTGVLLPWFVRDVSFENIAAAFGYYWSDYDPVLQGALPLAAAIALSVVLSYFVFSVPYEYMKRSLPEHMATFGGTLRALDASGLAMIRGFLLGSVVLLLCTGSLWVTVRWGGPSPTVNNVMLSPPGFSNPHPTWFLSYLFLPTVTVGMLFLALPVALATRFHLRKWQILAMVCAIWTCTGCLLGTSSYGATIYLIGFLQGLLFGVILLRYDLLTVFAAIFTLEAWTLTYPVYQIFGPTGGWVYASGIIIWATVAVLAFLLWWMPEIIGFGRRVKLALQ